MFKRLDDQEALQYHLEYARANSGQRKNYIADCIHNREFFFGSQWTKDEMDAMTARGQYAAKINRIKKSVTSLVGILNAEKPILKSVPFGETDHITSDICNKVFSHVFNNSMGVVVCNQLLNGGLRDNIGYALVKQNECNNTAFEFLPCESVIVDPDSNDPYFRDASVIYIEKTLSEKQIRKIYDIPDNVFLSPEMPDTWEQKVNDWNETLKVTKITDDSKMYYKVIEGYYRDVVPVEHGSFEKKVRITKRTLLGYQHAYEEELDERITGHCIIPLYFADTGNINKRGLVYFMKDIQRFLNKAFGVVLYGAQLNSNPKVFMYKDSVPNTNIKEFQERYNIPGSINFLEGDGKESQPPLVVQGQPINSAFFQIMQILMAELEFNSVNNQMTGSDINAEKNTTNTQLFQQFQLMLNSFREFLNLYEGFTSVLGGVILQHFFAYSSDDVIKRLFKLDELKMKANKILNAGFDPENPEAMMSYKEYLTSEERLHPAEVEVRVVNDKKVVDYLKKITDIIEDGKILRFDIAVEKGSYLASHSSLRFAMKLEMYNLNLIDNESVLLDAPIENKEEAIARVSQIKVLISQNMSLQVELEKALREIENLKKSVVDGTIEKQLIQHEGKLDKQYTQTRAKDSANIKISRMEERTKLKDQLMRGDQMIQEALLNLKKRQAEYELAKQKLEGQSEERPAADLLAEYLNQ